MSERVLLWLEESSHFTSLRRFVRQENWTQTRCVFQTSTDNQVTLVVTKPGIHKRAKSASTYFRQLPTAQPFQPNHSSAHPQPVATRQAAQHWWRHCLGGWIWSAICVRFCVDQKRSTRRRASVETSCAGRHSGNTTNDSNDNRLHCTKFWTRKYAIQVGSNKLELKNDIFLSQCHAGDWQARANQPGSSWIDRGCASLRRDLELPPAFFPNSYLLWSQGRNDTHWSPGRHETKRAKTNWRCFSNIPYSKQNKQQEAKLDDIDPLNKLLETNNRKAKTDKEVLSPRTILSKVKKHKHTWSSMGYSNA